MTGEEALAIVNRALKDAGRDPLNTLQTDILCGSVGNQSYEKIAEEKGYEAGHVKNTGSELCKLLSEVFGEKVKKNNVKAVLERYAEKPSAQNPGNCEYRNTKDEKPRPPNRPIPSNIPRKSPTFVEYGSIDQESYLSQVEQALENHQEVMLWGMGGVGKTELALQYAQKHKANYVAQYWLSIRDQGLAKAVVELAAPYIDLPEALQGKFLDDQAAWYWQNWLPDQGNLLVILDDVPTSESLLDRAMPKQERVKVIVTTRNRELEVRFASVSITEMPLVRAVELLEKIVGTDKVAKELYTLEAICDAVGCLPLAVELMGEYLKKNRHLNFAQVQHKLDRVLSQDRSYRKYGHRGVAAALQLTWEDLSAPSRNLAMFLSLFNRASIHWKLVKSIADSTDLKEIDLDEAWGELDRLHFLRPLNEDCTDFTVHALVQGFCQDKLTEQPDLDTVYRRAFVDCLLAISKQIPQTPTLGQIQAVAPAIPHLERLSQEEFLADIAKEDLIWAFQGIPRFYEGQGNYALAEFLYQNSVQAIQELLGDHHPDVATSLTSLALLYDFQGRYEEAEPLYRQALKLRQELLGDRHPNVAQSLNNLAFLYSSQRRYEEAEPLYRKALQLMQELLGKHHPDVAISLNNLAGLYYTQGRYDEAEPLFARAVEILLQTLGQDHPNIQASITNFVDCLQKAIAGGQGDLLSAHPLTQFLLKEIKGKKRKKKKKKGFM